MLLLFMQFIMQWELSDWKLIFCPHLHDDGHMYFMAIFMRNSKWIDTKFTESGSVKTRTNCQKITHAFIN